MTPNLMPERFARCDTQPVLYAQQMAVRDLLGKIHHDGVTYQPGFPQWANDQTMSMMRLWFKVMGIDQQMEAKKLFGEKYFRGCKNMRWHDEEKAVALLEWFEDGYDGPGWYYWDKEYPDGSVGAFKEKIEAIQHAEEADYVVA